jgi:hypothetical protein
LLTDFNLGKIQSPDLICCPLDKFLSGQLISVGQMPVLSGCCWIFSRRVDNQPAQFKSLIWSAGQVRTRPLTDGPVWDLNMIEFS